MERKRASVGSDPTVEQLGSAMVGKTIAGGKYEVIELLGEGGMGAVYKARQVAMDRMVALKLIRPEVVTSRSAVARFHKEMLVTAKVEHPNTIRVYDFGEADGQLYLTMEYLAGSSLRQVIDAAGRLEIKRIVRIGKQVANALGAVHERGLVHRDLKPENVMLIESYGETDFVKVLDFGIAKSLDEDVHLTGQGRPIGTPAYMSPEQAMGLAVDSRTDLYALGVLLYRMASGRMPFEAPTAASMLLAHATEAPTPVLTLAPDTSPPLAALIMQLLQKEPAQRPASAGEVVARLEDCLQSSAWQSWQAPGWQAPVVPGAAHASGSQAAEWHASGSQGSEGAEWHASASQGAGANSLDSHAPGSYAPGSQTPGLQAPEWHASASQPPLCYTPGSHAPGWQAHEAQPPAWHAPDPRAQGSMPMRGSEASTTKTTEDPKRGRIGLAIALVALIAVATGVVYAVTASGPTSRSPTSGSAQDPALIGSDSTLTGVAAKRKELDELLAKTEPLAPENCRAKDAATVTRLLDAARALGDDQREKALQILGSSPGASSEAWALLSRAQLATNAGSAQRAALEATRLCEGYAVAYNLSGNALQKLGNAKAAENAYLLALTAAPMYDAPRFNLGLLQLRENDATAVATFTELLRRRPEYPNAHLARAQAYVLRGNNDAALADLDEAVRRQPTSAEAWATLGELRERMHKNDANAAYCRAKQLGHTKAAERCKP
jgi:serine/threonine protein kinase